MSTQFDQETVVRYNLKNLGFHFYQEQNEEADALRTGIDKLLYRDILREIECEVEQAAENLKKTSAYSKLERSRGASIVFIGDSLTSDRSGHCAILKKTLCKNDKFRCIDAAVSGDTTLQVINRFYASVLAHGFDIAIIMLGTNDCRRNNDPYAKQMVSLCEYADNMEYFIRLLKSKGKTVVLTTIPYVDCERIKETFAADHYLYEEHIIEEYNKVLSELAEKHNVTLNGFCDALRNEYEEYPYISDGLHLTTGAQKFLAERELYILENLLK